VEGLVSAGGVISLLSETSACGSEILVVFFSGRLISAIEVDLVPAIFLFFKIIILENVKITPSRTAIANE
jgi:hypothetical protein